MSSYSQFVLDDAAKKIVAGIVASGKKIINTTSEVDVKGYATAQADATGIDPENIRKGVNILGVEGDFGEALTFDIITVNCRVTLYRQIDDEWVDISEGAESGTIAYGAQYKATVKANGSNRVVTFKVNGVDVRITDKLEEATPVEADLDNGIAIVAIASGDDSSSSN